MSARPPKHFVISINLDANLQFSYQDLFTQKDASNLTVINGDQVAWVLDPSISDRTLQIDFGTLNPFRIFRNVSLRGQGQVIAGKVNFPVAFPGNRLLKYTVSLGNGLHDDPDIVPVESDIGLDESLAFAADFKLKWEDGNYQALLNFGELSKPSGGGKVPVTWKWAVGPDDPTPPFRLEFISPPPGWPASTDSTDPHPAITLLLPPGDRTKFVIWTTSGDGANEIHADGYLEVT